MAEGLKNAMHEYADHTYLWHPELTGSEGKLFSKEEGQTLISLKARGWVDDPAKAGFLDVWGPQGREAAEVRHNDFKNGSIPAMDIELEIAPQEHAEKAAEVAALTAEKEALENRIRQLESDAKLAKMNDEDFLDQKSDARTLPKKTVDRGSPKAAKKAA